MDVEYERAAGIGGVGDVECAARQFPNEPGINGAKGEFAAIGFFSCTCDIV